MSIAPEDLYLRGRCKLASGSSTPKIVDCYLNLKDQVLDCKIDFETGLQDMGQTASQVYRVTDLELSSPGGPLRCAHVPVAFVGSIGGGNMSRYQTNLSHSLAMNSRLSGISFVINSNLSLEGDEEYHERLFFPGFDMLGAVEVEPNINVNGAKDYISLAGEAPGTIHDITTAIGIAIGAPVRQFAHQEGRTLHISLNNYAPMTKSRPMISTGSYFRDIDETRTNFTSAYRAATRYLTELAPPVRAGARNAIASYLDGRILSGSYGLKLLAGYHFLEWFDGTRTMSPNALADRLQISRKEADAINNVRNAIVHNRQDLSEVIALGWAQLRTADTERTRAAYNEDAGYAFMNYLYSLLGDSLLREIGYVGRTQSYLP